LYFENIEEKEKEKEKKRKIWNLLNQQIEDFFEF